MLRSLPPETPHHVTTRRKRHGPQPADEDQPGPSNNGKHKRRKPATLPTAADQVEIIVVDMKLHLVHPKTFKPLKKTSKSKLHPEREKEKTHIVNKPLLDDDIL